MKKYIANIITSCRILCSILMLFCPTFSIRFYIVYLFGGFSDMIDGIVARKTNTTSEFGGRLDTVADMIFILVALIKFLPVLYIPNWLWIWISVIAIIKIGNIIWGVMYNKKIISVHTIMNKITGVLLFFLPLILPFIELKYIAIVVCFIATFSAIQEGYIVRVERELVKVT